MVYACCMSILHDIVLLARDSIYAEHIICHVCSLSLECLGLETVSRGFFERLGLISIPSLQSLGLVSVSASCVSFTILLYAFVSLFRSFLYSLLSRAYPRHSQ